MFMSQIIVGSMFSPCSVLAHCKVFLLEMSYFGKKIWKENIYIIFIFADHYVDIDFSFS